MEMSKIHLDVLADWRSNVDPKGRVESVASFTAACCLLELLTNIAKQAARTMSPFCV